MSHRAGKSRYNGPSTTKNEDAQRGWGVTAVAGEAGGSWWVVTWGERWAMRAARSAAAASTDGPNAADSVVSRRNTMWWLCGVTLVRSASRWFQWRGNTEGWAREINSPGRGGWVVS